MSSTVAELSPPPEPFDPLADPETKKAIEIINMAEAIVDEVVTKLLNEVAEKVLKKYSFISSDVEEEIYCLQSINVFTMLGCSLQSMNILMGHKSFSSRSMKRREGVFSPKAQKRYVHKVSCIAKN